MSAGNAEREGGQILHGKAGADPVTEMSSLIPPPDPVQQVG